MSVSALAYYENIAEDYDEETKNPIMLAEDIVLFDFLKMENLIQGKVLDAGCGTGLFIDQCYWPHWKISSYKGYDFSKAMLDKFGKKWPSFKNDIHLMSFLDDHDKFGNAFDSVVSLYAGLNCLTRLEMKKAFENIWHCTKPGGAMCLMTYGNIEPENRSTSLHSIVSHKKGYAYSMIESCVLWTWLRDLPNSTNQRVIPFSCPDLTGEEPDGSDNLNCILYHKNRIQDELDEATLEMESRNYHKKGGTLPNNCSFYLCLAQKL